MKFKDLKISRDDLKGILIDGRSDRYEENFSNPGFVADDQYTGIELTNIELDGGFYSCFAANGMEATITNVSFLNYGRIGYINDRRARADGMKKVTFSKCKFVPSENDESGDFNFDARGISLDAGNTEYPVVWSGDGTTVENCEFLNTGVALSRVSNVNILNNKFIDNTAVVDLIHAEEFSNAIVISGNNFECNAKPTDPEREFERSRIVILDSELQAVNDITISDNVVTGEYNFLVNGFAPNKVTITDNDLSKAIPFGTSVIDFLWYENRNKVGEEIDENQEFVSRLITITGNKGLEILEKNCQLNVPEVDESNINIDADQFVSGKLILNAIPNPVPLRETGNYELINLGSNQKLASSPTGNSLITKDTDDSSVQWEFTWVPRTTIT
ncbi:hypothetical protein [Aquimarina agarivorans]|uniref:hypothetical protein n=1 Tax=Aquimarina agarivorans TaxID=980584 RepID=UPI000248FCE0|nr:hypothetical protein [Aquimarina agarivorans]